MTTIDEGPLMLESEIQFEHLELLAGYGPHLDHGLPLDALDDAQHPRRLRPTYPCPVHREPSRRTQRRGRLEADYACPRGHAFHVLRRPWPKGDSYIWHLTDEDTLQEIVGYQQSVDERRVYRIRQVGDLSRAQLVIADYVARHQSE